MFKENLEAGKRKFRCSHEDNPHASCRITEHRRLGRDFCRGGDGVGNLEIPLLNHAQTGSVELFFRRGEVIKEENSVQMIDFMKNDSRQNAACLQTDITKIGVFEFELDLFASFDVVP